MIHGVAKKNNFFCNGLQSFKALFNFHWHICHLGFLDGSAGKESPCNAGAAGDSGSIPGEGRSPGKGNGNLLQYSCLKNPLDRGTWQATVHGGHGESDTTEQRSMSTIM